MKTRWLLLYLLLAVQALGLGALYAYHAAGRDAKWRLLLEAGPVDPRDIFRGDYIILSYPGLVRNLDLDETKQRFDGEVLYAALRQKGDYWVTEQILDEPFAYGRPFLRGQVQGDRLTFGLERYYVPEGKGRPPGKITVEIAVRPDGSAQIRQLFNDGQPWP